MWALQIHGKLCWPVAIGVILPIVMAGGHERIASISVFSDQVRVLLCNEVGEDWLWPHDLI